MRRATTSERPAPRRHILKLQCPECTHSVSVARDELVEGASVFCRQCGNEAELTLRFDPGTGKEQWMLLDPLADFDDPEDEKRA
jgi:ribosomal protein S27E